MNSQFVQSSPKDSHIKGYSNSNVYMFQHFLNFDFGLNLSQLL